MSTGRLVDQGSGEVYTLGFEPVTIGRHTENSIVLADLQASRHHTEIAMQGGRWVVLDLGSANGTFVNGQRIAGPQVLSHQDEIRIGRTRFLVELPSAVAAQDTLVERLPAYAPTSAPARRSRLPLWLGLAAVAAVAVILVGLLVVWPAMQGDGDGVGGVGTGTSMAANTPTIEPGTPVVETRPPSRPTETAIPTIAPPTPRPTLPPPTAAPPPETDTPAPQPVIGFFRAGPSTIEVGQCTRLEWGQVENANRVTLSDVGRVGTSGKIDVCLDASKSYILRATGTAGTVEETVQITVNPPIGSIIEYFRVVPSVIAPGDCAQLEWGKVENATSAVIEPGIGGVGTPGSTQVCPGATTTYLLTAQNPEGSSTARTTLIVASDAAQLPVIAFFTANPGRIQAGECTTLSWGKVDYASAVTIDNGIGGVGTPGSKEICLGVTTTFLMTAEGPGGTTEYDVTVSVSPGQLANLPDLTVESILFEPNPCYRALKCKVRVKVRNDGPVDAGHFVVRWAPEGDESVPVEWDVDGLGTGQEKVLSYTWIPDRVKESWLTVAVADANNEVGEIEEGQANSVEQVITVLEP